MQNHVETLNEQSNYSIKAVKYLFYSKGRHVPGASRSDFTSATEYKSRNT